MVVTFWEKFRRKLTTNLPARYFRSVIPAQAGIHFSHWNKTLAWVPAFAGTTLRPRFNRFADFFTRSFAGETLRKSGESFGRISH